MYNKFSKEYRQYLESFDWKIKRKSAIERAGHRCQVCGMYPRQGQYLEVHHKTYTNLGRESFDDLLVVCPDCHNDKHAEKDDAQYRRMMTWAQNWIPNYKNMSEEYIQSQYNSFVSRKSGGRKSKNVIIS